jgi:HAD superfamily hydrolase (TIGR01549 family)
VIFDVDGTLVDSVDQHAAAWQRTFAHFGYDVDFAAVRWQIGKGGDQLMPVFLPKEDIERRGKEIEEYRLELFKREYLPDVRGFPKVRELFERILGEGKRIALASSAKGDELNAYKRAANIADLVHQETSADDAKRSKPHPDIFEAALARLKLPPQHGVVVGDSPYDAEAAGKAGLKTIGVLCGGFPEAALRKAGAAQIFRDPADLLANFDRSLISNHATQIRGRPMTAKSQDPTQPRPSTKGARQDADAKVRPAPGMPPAGPHAEPHLTNPDATPGTGSLTKTDHGEVETDPGGG